MVTKCNINEYVDPLNKQFYSIHSLAKKSSCCTIAFCYIPTQFHLTCLQQNVTNLLVNRPLRFLLTKKCH